MKYGCGITLLVPPLFLRFPSSPHSNAITCTTKVRESFPDPDLQYWKRQAYNTSSARLSSGTVHCIYPSSLEMLFVFILNTCLISLHFEILCFSLATQNLEEIFQFQYVVLFLVTVVLSTRISNYLSYYPNLLAQVIALQNESVGIAPNKSSLLLASAGKRKHVVQMGNQQFQN